jgi:hypothetical protein
MVPTCLRIVWSTLVTTLLLASAPLDAAPLDTPTGRLSLGPIPGASTEENLRLAILAVHAFVEKHRKLEPGETPRDTLVEVLDHVDPMPIDVAAKIIKQDSSTQAPARQRRTVVRLLRWVRDVPGVREAVEILTGSPEKTKEIYRKLVLHDHGGACQTDEDQVFINEVLNAELGKTPQGLCADVTTQMATVTYKGDAVIVASKVIAEGPLDGARAGLDPQRWQTCSSLWKESFLVLTDMSGNTVDNGSCSPSDHVDCLPSRGAVVLPYGSSYNTDVLNRPFFEKFVCQGSWCDVRVLLRIVTEHPAPPLDYKLTYDEPRQWKAFPFPPTDQGTVRISAADIPGEPRNKTLTVEADKAFKFGNWTTDFSIYFLLRRVEMANYLADLVCCDAP